MPSKRPTFGFLAERYGPFAIAVAGAITVTRFSSMWLFGTKWLDSMLDKMLDIEIGLTAGLIAIVAFLPAIEEKTVIRKFKQWGYYKYLVSYLTEAICASALATVLSLILIVYSDAWKYHPQVNRYISGLWWGLVIYSFATAFRIVKLSLKSLLAKQDRPSPF